MHSDYNNNGTLNLSIQTHLDLDGLLGRFYYLFIS